MRNKYMDPNTFGEAFKEGIFSGFVDVFKLLFLTSPTCYIVYGIIIFSILLIILRKIIRRKH